MIDASLVARRVAARRLFAIEGDPTARGYGEAFMRTYLPHYARHPVTGAYVPPAAWHDEFDQQVYGTLGQGAREVFLAPRGYAKSTKVSLVTVLIALARQMKQYLLLIQETGPQAKQAMSQVIHELDSNELLLADFPHLARAYVNGRPVADRDDDIAFASGARLQALGAGGSLRGRRNKEQRPDLVLIDDLEDDEHVRTKYQRDKLDEWVSSALIGALGPGADVYMVGTLLHHDAVLARLLDRWNGHRYEAMTDAADYSTTTWPELWPAERLEAARRDMGAAAFSREMLHEPISDEDKVFPRTRYRWRDMRSRLLAAEHGEFPSVKLRLAIDPAIGEKVTNDYTAITTAAQVQPGEYDVLDVWQGRLKQAALIERCCQIDQLWKRYAPVWLVESVAAQAWLAQELRRRGLAVREVRPQKDKLLRAEPVGVLYENGQVYHDEALRDGDFELQMHQFPVAEHDDQVDATVYALTDLASSPTPRITRL